MLSLPNKEIDKYNIGEVCKILNIKEYTLRYMEKVLDLSFSRDEYLNRYYSSADISLLKNIINLRNNEGLSYKDIKKVLSSNSEVAVTNVAVAPSSPDNIINVPNNSEKGIDLNQIIELVQDIISESIDNTLSPKLNQLQNELHEVKILNEKLLAENKKARKALDQQMEKHFRELDEKLLAIRDKNANKKKSFLYRFFNK